MKVAAAFLLICFCIPLHGQNTLNLDDIWTNGTFTPRKLESIQWMQNSDFFLALNGNRIMKFEVEGGGQGQIVLDGNEINLQISEFSMNQDETKILLLTNKEAVWRRSYKGNYFLYDLADGTLKPLSEKGRQSFATFSPDSKMVAFVRDYDLYVKDIDKNEEIRITDDGRENEILNGWADWLYEEEFYMTRAFEWSPNSDKLAYIKFDLTDVPLYPLQNWTGLYTDVEKIRYSKPGEKVSEVSMKIYHLETNKEVEVNLGEEKDFYVPKFQWTKNNDLLSVMRLSRVQNKLDIMHVGAHSGMAQIVLIDASRTYVDFNFINELFYLDDGNSFVYPSEKTGYKHYFHFEMSGKLIRQITTGDFEVAKLIMADSKSGNLYYTSTEEGSTQRHFYEISLKGKRKRRLSIEPGWHEPTISPDGKYFVDHFSNLSTPPSFKVYSISNGKLLSTLEENAELSEKRKAFGLVVPELINFETVDSTFLNGYSILPPNIEQGKKVPALIYVYGGPNSQKVKNKWQFTGRELWHQYMVQKGYAVYCFDNRGTAAKGVIFKKQIYRNLGKMETEDQILIAKDLAKADFIDENRIGIWGWSYGGYMSALCKFLEPELYKTAVSVAPVTHWKYYDAAYTERYMQLPNDNEAGYEAFSPINLAGDLEGDFLLIHAAGDDNVHIQNSMELAKELVQQGKEFEYFVYPEGAHSINVGETRKHVYNKIAEYLLKNL